MSDKIVCGYTKRDLSRQIIAVSITEKLNPTFLAEWEKWFDNAPADPEPADGKDNSMVQAAPVSPQIAAINQLREHLQPKGGYTEAQTLRIARNVLNEVVQLFMNSARTAESAEKVWELFGQKLKTLVEQTEHPDWLKSMQID